MSNDELKRLAEDVGSDLWHAAHSRSSGRGWEVVQGVDQVADGMTEARARFIAAANPSVILALIAENERLRSENDEPEWHAMMTRLEDHNVQLKAEAYGLKRDGMIEAQKACDRIAGDYRGRSDRERKGAGECSGAIRALIAAMSKEVKP